MSGRAFDSRRALGARVSGLTMLAALILAAPEAAGSAEPPASRTYLVIAVGLEERYSWQAACLSFARDEVCTSEGDCGSWSTTEPGPDGEISLELQLGDDQAPVYLEGRMRIETRGKRETIGGTLLASVGEQAVALSLVGRSTTRRDCLDQLDSWEAASTR